METNKKILQAVAWLVIIMVLIAVGCSIGQSIEFRPALTADSPLVGVGRAVTADARVYLGNCCPDDVETTHYLETYQEWDGAVPDWYRPWEPMAIEWEARERHDGGCPDWNLDSTLWGWDGHSCEAWEFETFVRIAYLEVWGSSEECCKAVVDAILALWDSGYYGRTLFETLSAVTETGWYAFSTYPGMWSVTYDSDGLDEIRTLCMERFVGGYEYDAPFFRTDYYHPWAVDAYHIDNVYFSYSPWMK